MTVCNCTSLDTLQGIWKGYFCRSWLLNVNWKGLEKWSVVTYFQILWIRLRNWTCLKLNCSSWPPNNLAHVCCFHISLHHINLSWKKLDKLLWTNGRRDSWFNALESPALKEFTDARDVVQAISLRPCFGPKPVRVGTGGLSRLFSERFGILSNVITSIRHIHFFIYHRRYIT